MKQVLFFLIFNLLLSTLSAQKKAVTENGDEVILYDDGTWKYAKKSDEAKNEIPVNPAEFKKSPSATFQVKSKRIPIGIWLDTKKWSFSKPESEEDDSEFEFEMRGKDLYGMMITESMEVPLQSLRKIALQNAKEAAPDIEIIKEEYRTVNNNKVLHLQMNGTIEGIPFTYYGYYFSSAAGTVQLITYTSQNLFKTLAKEAEELLNGLATF